jgi:hypothetical protein
VIEYVKKHFCHNSKHSFPHFPQNRTRALVARRRTIAYRTVGIATRVGVKRRDYLGHRARVFIVFLNVRGMAWRVQESVNAWVEVGGTITFGVMMIIKAVVFDHVAMREGMNEFFRYFLYKFSSFFVILRVFFVWPWRVLQYQLMYKRFVTNPWNARM